MKDYSFSRRAGKRADEAGETSRSGDADDITADEVLEWMDRHVPEATRSHLPTAATIVLSAILLLIILLVGGVSWGVSAAAGDHWSWAKWTFLGALGGVLLAILMFVYLMADSVNKALTVSARNAALKTVKDATTAEARLSGNRQVLALWEEMVRREAGLTYRYTMIAMGASLLVVIIGALIIISTGDIASQVSVAGLSGIGAALSGLVAKNFLEVHRIAQRQLNFYFVEPLVTNYLLSAERIVEKIKEEQPHAAETMQDQLVKAMLDAARASVTLSQPVAAAEPAMAPEADGRNALAS